MRFRIRGPSGQSTATLSSDATIEDLKIKIIESTSISSFDVKYGYPPKELNLNAHADDAPVSELHLDGEQLIISEIPGAASSKDTRPKPPNASSAALQQDTNAAAPLSLSRKQPSEDPPELPMPSHSSTLVLRIMPDDNSCLFRAFNSAYFGLMDNMHELRSIIAQAIQQDPDTYSAVVLERAPDDYCRWIQHPDSWGGQIELQILSQHFDVEVCSIDVQTLRVDRYNEGQPRRCILVYSGIHYDVVALSPSDPPFNHSCAPPDLDVKVFEAYDDDIIDRAKELCKILQGRGYYTDTAGFGVRCDDCGATFTGEKGATEHAMSTGHMNFGEA
ncbi:MAG: hypothetical protein LQ340_004147 [Diploschistes diacapsis]|nr:MAG: hypothetical protein LQ340_004147 [Diploschistes diacapsis]